MDLALTRAVSPEIGRCQLSFAERQLIDVPHAVEQHARYCAMLARLGLEVFELPADAALPDCCFVEDVAVVLDEVAVITRPGAAARRAETRAVRDALASYRPIARLAGPATLDGGDVLRVGRRLFVGRSRRTNVAGIEALRAVVEPLGYALVPVDVTGCLHLKSAVTALDDDSVLANRDLIDAAPFTQLEIVDVPDEEPGAANVLALGGRVIAHAGFPRTLELLARRGLDVRPVDVSEFVKAEAGVTCKSLVFRRAPRA